VIAKKTREEVAYLKKNVIDEFEKGRARGRMSGRGYLERRELRGGIVTVIERRWEKQNGEEILGVMEGALKKGIEIGEVVMGPRVQLGVWMGDIILLLPIEQRA
jgi:hypothetical protein